MKQSGGGLRQGFCWKFSSSFFYFYFYFLFFIFLFNICVFSYVAVSICLWTKWRCLGSSFLLLLFFKILRFWIELRWVICFPCELAWYLERMRVVEMMFANWTCLSGNTRKGGIRNNRILKELRGGINSRWDAGKYLTWCGHLHWRPSDAPIKKSG